MRKRIEMSEEWHRTEHQWSASLKIFWMAVGVICEWFIKALELKVNTLTFRRRVNSVLRCRVWTCDLSRIKVSFITIGEDNGGPPQQPSHRETLRTEVLLNWLTFLPDETRSLSIFVKTLLFADVLYDIKNARRPGTGLIDCSTRRIRKVNCSSRIFYGFCYVY